MLIHISDDYYQGYTCHDATNCNGSCYCGDAVEVDDNVGRSWITVQDLYNFIQEEIGKAHDAAMRKNYSRGK